MLFNIFIGTKTLVKYRQLDYQLPNEFLFWGIVHILYVLILVLYLKRVNRNEKMELIRHISITTEGLHIETNQSSFGLMYRKKNISVTLIPYGDITSCKYDHILPVHRRKWIGEIYNKMGKCLQLKIKGSVCNRKVIVEGIIHGDTMVQLILWLRDNKL